MFFKEIEKNDPKISMESEKILNIQGNLKWEQESWTHRTY